MVLSMSHRNRSPRRSNRLMAESAKNTFLFLTAITRWSSVSFSISDIVVLILLRRPLERHWLDSRFLSLVTMILLMRYRYPSNKCFSSRRSLVR